MTGLAIGDRGSVAASDIADYFAHRAAHTDGPEGDVREGLRFLGRLSLLDLGAGTDGGPGLLAAVELIEEVAAECLSSAFSLWAHRMTLEYLARGRSTPSMQDAVDRLRGGETVGCSAMSTALRDIAGLEPTPLVAERSGASVRVSGPIRWASNLFADALIVAPARTDDGGRVVVAIDADARGVTIAPPPTLLALNGTRSSSVSLDRVPVPADAVLSTDLVAFSAAFRPTFLLLQTAFCTGVAGRSVAEATSRIDGANAELAGDVAEQRATLARLRTSAQHAARDTRGQPLRELIRLRLDAARLAVSAARLEATVSGGRGYVASSPTSRRLRETAFLPIQSPTEGHLRWELQHQS